MSKYLFMVFIVIVSGITSGCVSEDLPASEGSTTTVTLEPVVPDEIYKMFMCPCCGNPIDSDCCGASVERQNYANGLIDAGLSKDEVVMKMVQAYGINSLIDASDRESVRDELIKLAPENRPQISNISN